MTDPIDYEPKRAPSPRGFDWGVWGASAYAIVLVFAVAMCVFVAMLIHMIENDG